MAIAYFTFSSNIVDHLKSNSLVISNVGMLVTTSLMHAFSCIVKSILVDYHILGLRSIFSILLSHPCGFITCQDESFRVNGVWLIFENLSSFETNWYTSSEYRDQQEKIRKFYCIPLSDSGLMGIQGQEEREW